MDKYISSDTESIMFSAIDTKKKSRIFRISATLIDEEVKPNQLKKAVELVMKRYPTFLYRQIPGLFWAHLEKSDKLPPVLPEKLRPTALRRLGLDGSPEVVFFYYKNRISVEASHMNGDGNGFVQILKSVIAQYMILGGSNPADFDGIVLPDTPMSETETKDPLTMFYDGKKPVKENSDKAYVIPKHFEKDYFNNVTGLMNTAEIKEICKKYSMSVTEVLVAALIFAIIKADKNPIDKSIVVEVPVNMRQHFPTNSIRNFSAAVRVVFSPDGRQDITFSEICTAVAGQIKKKNTKAHSQNFINSKFSLTTNPILRVIPFFIKHPGLNAIQQGVHNNEMTVLLSNLGNISLPPVMEAKIDRFEFVSGDPSVYNMYMFCTATSLHGVIAMNFGIAGKNTDIPKEYFRMLANEGINIKVESLDENGLENNKDFSYKRCNCCNVYSAKEYSICPLCAAPLVTADCCIPDVPTSLYPQPYEKVIHEKPAKIKHEYSKEWAKQYFKLKP